MKIFNVVFTKLVAKNATQKADLQRLVNANESMDLLGNEVVNKLEEMIVTESAIARWQEMRTASTQAIEEKQEEDGKVD